MVEPEPRRGCSASVWVYPTQEQGGKLHFLADSNAAITKGIVALVLAAVQDKPAAEVAATDIAEGPARDVVVSVDVKDAAGDVVAHADINMYVSPKKKAA